MEMPDAIVKLVRGTGWVSAVLLGLMWALFMLLSTHFLFGVTWITGIILWSVGGGIFAALVHTRLARRSS